MTTTAADGQHTINGMPYGATSLTPHLVVTPAQAAIKFYRDALGATVEDVTAFGDTIAHAELDFGTGRLTLSEPMEGYGLHATDRARTTYSLGLYVSDVDSVVARAEAAGSVVHEEVATFVSGDRFASLLDPFGVRWSIMTRVEDLSPAESRRRVAEWAAAQ